MVMKNLGSTKFLIREMDAVYVVRKVEGMMAASDWKRWDRMDAIGEPTNFLDDKIRW